jgi:transposase InsO family protein
MRTPLVEDALTAAVRERGTLAGAVFHSDHGTVYTSRAYAALCEKLRVTQSMGTIGSSADNAPAESFTASLKRELLAGAHAFPDQASAYRAVFRWANRYNTAAVTPRSGTSHLTPTKPPRSLPLRKRHKQSSTMSKN